MPRHLVYTKVTLKYKYYHHVYKSNTERGERQLNDYVDGALSALSWVQQLLKEKKAEDVLSEIETAIQTMLKGVGIDFRRLIEIPD